MHFVRRYSHTSAKTLPRLIGQPHRVTHPHLLSNGEVTVGTTLAEYQERRERLISLMPEDSVCVLQAAPMKIMSHDIPYRFRQNCDFLYLTGCHEPGAMAVISKKLGFVLFLADRDPKKELWDGPMTGVDGARYIGADDAHSVRETTMVLSQILQRVHGTVFRGGDRQSRSLDDAVTAAMQSAPIGGRVQDASATIQSMRVTKSASELELMRNAARIASDAFKHAIPEATEGVNEWTIEAMLEYHVKLHGANRLGYPPVVAGGSNATILHYINNDMLLKKGALLLVDAGADYHHYNSDITRTWPVGAPFSPIQKEVYEMVLRVQKECVKQCVSGSSLSAMGVTAFSEMEKGLVQLGISPRALGGIQRFYPHSIGHWLGMDVHDTPLISSRSTFEPGMCVTIEPGAYFPNDDDIPKELRGIGIRIEDDVVVTSDGHAPEVLTDNVPKEVHELERLATGVHG